MYPHDAPASITPSKTSVPLHAPLSGPLAWNPIGCADGLLVSPLARRFCPLGAAIVPPHVHVLAARADAVPPASTDRAPAMTHAATPRVPMNQRLPEPVLNRPLIL